MSEHDKFQGVWVDNSEYAKMVRDLENARKNNINNRIVSLESRIAQLESRIANLEAELNKKK